MNNKLTVQKMKKPNYRVFDENKQKYVMPKNYIINREAEMRLNDLTEEQWHERHWTLLEIKWTKGAISQQKLNEKNRYNREAEKFRNILIM